MRAPDDRPIRAVYIYNKAHGELQWEGSRRIWVWKGAPPTLYHRNADQQSIRASIAMRLGVPVSAVELRAVPR